MCVEEECRCFLLSLLEEQKADIYDSSFWYLIFVYLKVNSEEW
jgi:hypothetical protein